MRDQAKKTTQGKMCRQEFPKEQGPWLFVLMIDGIDIRDTDLWKYVDDTTAAKMVEKGETNKIQNTDGK